MTRGSEAACDRRRSDVVVGEAGSTGEHELRLPVDGREGAQQEVRRLLRNEAADEEDVVTASKTESPADPIRGTMDRIPDTVRDVPRRSVVPPAEMLREVTGHHDRRVGDARAHPLAESEDQLRRPAPFGSFGVEAVDGQDDLRAGQVSRQHGGQSRAHGVVVDDVRIGEHRVDRGERAVHDRVEVLRADGRQVAGSHPSVDRLSFRRVVRAAVHGDLMPSFGESRAQFLDVMLDSAERRGDAALTDHRDAHRHCRPASADASR